MKAWILCGAIHSWLLMLWKKGWRPEAFTCRRRGMRTSASMIFYTREEYALTDDRGAGRYQFHPALHQERCDYSDGGESDLQPDA